MSSTYEGDFVTLTAGWIDSVVNPFAKYVIDNYANLSETTQEELAHAFRELLSLPKVNTAPTLAMGIAGMAPTLNGFGSIAPPVAAGPKKPRATTSKKDAPVQLWISVDEYKTRVSDGLKICGYYSSRVQDESKKKKVCGAECLDATDSDHRKWRCVNCKGKAGEIEKELKDKVHGIDPGVPRPGFNIPNNSVTPTRIPPSVPLPAAPSLMGGVPGFPMMPPSIGNPVVPGIVGLPAALPPPMMPPSIGSVNPVAPSLMGGVPGLPMSLPTPIKPPSPVGQPSFDFHAGLDPKVYLIAKNENLKSIIFKRDGASVVAIGKIENLSTPAPDNYADLISELSGDEESVLGRYQIAYKFGA